MALDIPLNDTSSAGLGITLKGKTSVVNGKTVDFGIFVKSVLTGGAAYRVRESHVYLKDHSHTILNMHHIL